MSHLAERGGSGVSNDPEIEELGRRFQERYSRELEAIGRLEAAPIAPGEKASAALLRRITATGLTDVLRRRPAGASEILGLVDRFLRQGAKAILNTGAQRGGDFLNNQLRGRWAEQVVLSMDIKGLVTVPFGPSGAAMPGEEDYEEVVRTFRAIHLLEGKRPDLLAFDRGVWSSLSDDARRAAESWPTRLLEPDDLALVSRAHCAIEVKNSTWHYETRRRAHERPLAITVKSEGKRSGPPGRRMTA